jgi:hypothetical protein
MPKTGSENAIGSFLRGSRFRSDIPAPGNAHIARELEYVIDHAVNTMQDAALLGTLELKEGDDQTFSNLGAVYTAWFAAVKIGDRGKDAVN